MSSDRKRRRSKQEKRRSARTGAVLFIALAAGALALSISTGSCDSERTRRTSVTALVTGDRSYVRERLTTCGFVRGLTPDALDAIPCQVWNLLPLNLIGVLALVWLLRDLAGLDSRYRD